MNRVLVKPALLACVLTAVAIAVPTAAQPVPNDLPIGTCVAAYGSSGRIVDKVPGGYRIASDEPGGSPFIGTAASTVRAACKGAPAAAPAGPVQPPRAAVAPAKATAPQQGATGKNCPASSAAAVSGQARNYANAILSNWTTPAAPGSDGAVTAVIESVKVGAARKATFWDKDNASLNPAKPVIPMVVKATMCTDFRTRMTYHQVQENFICYTKSAGGLACGEIAHSGDLPQPRNWEVLK